MADDHNDDVPELADEILSDRSSTGGISMAAYNFLTTAASTDEIGVARVAATFNSAASFDKE